MTRNADTGNPISQFHRQQNLSLFRVYSWYRLALAFVLAAMLFGTRDDPLVGRGDPQLFAFLCGAYFIYAALLLLAPLFWRVDQRQLFANFVIDIALLCALAHLSGGTAGGLPLLLLVAVAAAGLILSGQIGLLVAALATLALLADTVYLIGAHPESNQSLLTAGTLGILFFAITLGFQQLSQRLRTTQLLAQQRAADVSKLQMLNQLIVQRMRTGILVVDDAQHVQIVNQAAVELLHAEDLQRQLEQGLNPQLHAVMARQLLQWKEDPYAHSEPFLSAETGPELIARFTALDHAKPGDTLIFLEDNGQLAQRAQQLKLAALGRLTASIAHEIRNPLGAVSHAAQLLQESPELAGGDHRLAEIILNHSRRMNAIIENILQLSRRSPPNPRRLDLGAWLYDYLDEYRQGCIEPGTATIRELKPVQVTVDPDQLSQVLTNLLDNAMRYSRKATGRASAELNINLTATGLPQLDIVDDGPGIDGRDQEKIFEPFFTTETKGNGLGLYIARELCEINQARLNYIRNNQGKSCFRINFSHPDRKPLITD
jgi:two-component system sensor histidine kinase PilS (NtrC family)